MRHSQHSRHVTHESTTEAQLLTMAVFGRAAGVCMAVAVAASVLAVEAKKPKEPVYADKELQQWFRNKQVRRGDNLG